MARVRQSLFGLIQLVYKECLPGPTILYKEPHSRNPIVSRANGNGSGLQTYSCVPLHLRGSALDCSETKAQTKVNSSNNTADSDKVKSDNTVKQTRVWTQNPYSSLIRADGPRGSGAQ